MGWLVGIWALSGASSPGESGSRLDGWLGSGPYQGLALLVSQAQGGMVGWDLGPIRG